MKHKFTDFCVKILILVLIPLVSTLTITGFHNEPILIPEDASYVEVKSASITEAVDTNEYILGVTAGFMTDWDFNAEGTSEVVKLCGVLINTYMALNSESTIVMNADDFDLNYLNPDKRRLLWGDLEYQQYEQLLSGWLSEISGLVIKSEGSLITPYFHRISAGATRSGPFPYLISVDTSRDLENSNFLNVSEIKFTDFFNIITEKYPDCGIVENNLSTSIQIIGRDDAGYVTNILIGNTSMSGEEFAEIFNLPSSSFTIAFQENSLKFITKGIGHGYGISLCHAAYLASQQYTYDTIIGYFYDNIEITGE